MEPWLLLGGDRPNIAEQRDDPGSTLSFCRDLIALRRRLPDLREGDYEPLPSPPGVWAWRRGSSCAAVVNLSPAPAVVDGAEGTILIGTGPPARR